MRMEWTDSQQTTVWLAIHYKKTERVAMLHIINGDASADLLRAAEMPGEIQPWREALLAGPTPQGLSPQEWLDTRAQFLSESYGQNFEVCRNLLIQQEEALTRFPHHEEVVLWFESDLFCQVNLLYLLNWFASQSLGRTTLSLICIGSFPGMIGFRGLGNLSPQQLASLFERRQAVPPETLRLAQEAWAAYCAPEPNKLFKLLKKNTTALPFLKNAIQAHLQRLPSLRNGLGKIENTALDIIAGGIDEFEPLFIIFRDLEPNYGLGDVQFFDALNKLISNAAPAVQVVGLEAPYEPLSFSECLLCSFELSKIGEAIWQGRMDFIELNGIDEWLGGVRLQDKRDHWRWDEQKERIVHFTSSNARGKSAFTHIQAE